jgi:hypothetical protein
MAHWHLKNLDSDDPAARISNVDTLEEALATYGFTAENDTEWSLEPTAHPARWYVFRATDNTEYVLRRQD